MIKLSLEKIDANKRLDPFILSLLNDKIWLAGGALRSAYNKTEDIVDYDLFFSSKQFVEPTKQKLEQKGYKKIFECPEGKLTTYCLNDIKVQCITEFYYSQQFNLIDSFDICACRYSTNGKNVYTFYSSLRDSKKKLINLNRIDFPAATLKRIAKYSKKGYRLTNKATEKFVNHIYESGKNNLDLDNRIYID